MGQGLPQLITSQVLQPVGATGHLGHAVRQHLRGQWGPARRNRLPLSQAPRLQRLQPPVQAPGQVRGVSQHHPHPQQPVPLTSIHRRLSRSTNQLPGPLSRLRPHRRVRHPVPQSHHTPHQGRPLRTRQQLIRIVQHRQLPHRPRSPQPRHILSKPVTVLQISGELLLELLADGGVAGRGALALIEGSHTSQDLLGTHQAQSRELPIELTRHLPRRHTGGLTRVVRHHHRAYLVTPPISPHPGTSLLQGSRPLPHQHRPAPSRPRGKHVPHHQTTSTPTSARHTSTPARTLPGTRPTRTPAAHNPPPEPFRPEPSGPPWSPGPSWPSGSLWVSGSPGVPVSVLSGSVLLGMAPWSMRNWVAAPPQAAIRSTPRYLGVDCANPTR